MTILRPLLLLTFTTTLACSAPNGELPVIDDVQAPQTLASVDGAYSVSVTVHCHDASAAITQARLTIPSMSESFTVPVPETASTTSAFILFASFRAAPETLDYGITVVDANGAESAPFESTITLE